MAGPAAVPGVDPSRVNTPDELAACLEGLRLRRGLSYEVMEKAAAKLPSRSGRSRLEPCPRARWARSLGVSGCPPRASCSLSLRCATSPRPIAQWLAAWERASTADLARPVGGVRVRDARPRLLGVHAAISVPGVPDDVPPEYVPRDVDAAEFGIRTGSRPRRRRAGSCCWSAGPRSGRPAARSRR